MSMQHVMPCVLPKHVKTQKHTFTLSFKFTLSGDLYQLCQVRCDEMNYKRCPFVLCAKKRSY